MDLGLSLAGVSSGSFPGPESFLYLFGPYTRAAFLNSRCASVGGVSSLPISTGALAVNVLATGPTFGSVDSASFTEASYGTFSVDVSDNLPTVVTCIGDLPPGLSYTQDPQAFGGTIAGTPIPGSAGDYTVQLLASDRAGLFAEQTVDVTVAPSTLPYVDSISPAQDGNVGATVTITGSNLNNAVAVQFGSVQAADLVHVGDTKLQVTEPDGAYAGPEDVTVGIKHLSTVEWMSPTPGDVFTYELAPQQPTAPSVQPLGLGIYASWDPNPSADAVTKYNVFASLATGYTLPKGCPRSREVSVAGSVTAVEIPIRCTGAPYVVTMDAVNAFGSSNLKLANQSTPVVPNPQVQPSEPVIVSASPKNKAAIVRLQAPNTWGGSTPTSSHYSLAVRGKGSTRTINLPSTLSAYVLTGLTNGVKYTLALSAANSSGASPAFVTYVIPEAKVLPLAPAGFEVVPDGKGDLDVDWLPPADTGTAPVEHYVLRYSVVPNFVPTSHTGKVTKGKSGSVIASSKVSSFVLGKSLLALDAYYQLSLVAVTSAGPSPAVSLRNPVTPDVVMNPDAVELSSATIHGVRSGPNGVLTWPSAPSQLSALRAGEFVAAPSSTLFPRGLSSQVESILKPVGGGLVLYTTPVSPAEVFMTYSFGVQGTPPSYSNLRAGSNVITGVRAESRGMLASPHLSGGDTVSHSITLPFGTCGTESNPGNCLTATITISVGAGGWMDWNCVSHWWDVLWCVAWGAVTILSGGTIPPMPTDAGFWVYQGGDISGSIQFNQSASNNWNLGTYPLAAIPIPLVGAIIPQVVFSMAVAGKIQIYIGFHHEWGGGLQCGYSVGQLSAGCSPYDDPQADEWDNDGSNGVTVSLHASGSATLSAVFDVSVDSIFGPDVTAKLKLTGSASATTSVLNLNLCAYISIAGGMDIDLWIFGDHPLNGTILSEKIGCVNYSSNKPVLEISASGQASGSCSLEIGIGVQQFSETRSDGASDPPITWSLQNGAAGDSISSAGLLSVGSAASGRELTVVAKDATGASGTLQCTVGTTYAFSPPTGLSISPTAVFVNPLGIAENWPGHETATWTAPVNQGGYPIAFYDICFSGDNDCERTNGPVTSYVFPRDVVPGTAVGWATVYAFNDHLDGSPASNQAIYSGDVYLTSDSVSTGTGAPTITVNGNDLGTGPTGGSMAPGCGYGGGVDYPNATLSLTVVHDSGDEWAAGDPGDCVGVSVVSWTPTQVVFTLGDGYGHSDWTLGQGDVFFVTVECAQYEDDTTFAGGTP